MKRRQSDDELQSMCSRVLYCDQDGKDFTLQNGILYDDFVAKFDADYSANRVSQYPSIQEQLDMQYWDSVNGTSTWKDAIAKVKSDNPKPS